MKVEHIVLLKPKPEADELRIAALWDGIAGLKGLIPGIESIRVGVNSSPESLSQGYTLGFVVTFESSVSRDGYLPDPDHLAVVPLVHAVAAEVLVFDLERH